MSALSSGSSVGRYKVHSAVGGGGMGEVYRAYDPLLDRDVAIKVITPGTQMDDAAVRRFTREAQAASALNHPNIVTLFDVGDCPSGPYLVMELVHGETLRARMKGSANVEMFRSVAPQVARALMVAHASGIVHRDVKPENVMVRADGLAKLVDFGLARVVPPDAATHLHTQDEEAASGSVVGTLSYMPPEQARGELVEGPADVFALGLVFYELVTGRHPFARETALATMASILRDTPPRPSAFNPDIPEPLETLILGMLEKMPAARPSAGDVERALTAMQQGRPVVAATVVRRSVGHDAELTTLGAALESAERGRGAMVALGGEAGIGKSTLVRDFLRQCASAGARLAVAHGRCSERLGDAGAYLPWLEALESVRDEGGAGYLDLLKLVAPTWHAQVAPLGEGDSSEARALIVNHAGSQEWMKRELFRFCESVSRQRTLVIVLDDVHWADVSTVDLLSYLAPRIADLRVLLLITYRPSDLEQSRHPMLALNRDLQGRGICRDVQVGFLSVDDVAQYVALEFPDHQFPTGFAALIHQKTEGSPLFMAELLRRFRDRGVIDRVDGAWRLTGDEAAVIADVPASLRSLIALAIDRLGEADRRLLVAASVMGATFDSATVARALDLDAGEVEERLDSLGRLHAIVRATGEAELPDRTLTVLYSFVHVLYQNALYATLGPSRRASLSAAVARAIVAGWGTEQGTHARDLALLYEAARDFSNAAAQFLVASERARQVFADREALVLARRGLEMLSQLPDTPERAPREVMHLMGVALPLQAVDSYASVSLEQTYARAQALCDALGTPPQTFPVLVGISAFNFIRGRLRESLGNLEHLRTMAGASGDPVAVMWSGWGFGSVWAHLGERLHEAHEALARGAASYIPEQHRALVLSGFDAGIGCHLQDGRLLWQLGFPEQARRRLDEGARLADALGHPHMTLFARFFTAWVAQMDEDAEAVRATTRDALPVAEQYGYPMVGGWLSVLNGWAEARLGRLDEGARSMSAAIARLDTIGARLLQPYFLTLSAEAVAASGKPDEAVDLLQRAARVADATGDRFHEPERLRMLASLTADAEVAGELLTQALTMSASCGSRLFQLRAANALAGHRAATGQSAWVREMLEPLLAGLTEGLDRADCRRAREILAR